MSLVDLIPATWRGALAQATAEDSFSGLNAFLEAQWREGVVFPPKPQVFAALERTPPEAVRVVLLGQDPYPTAGNANGLAFSVTKGVKVPASLKNVFLGLQADLGAPIPTHGDLTPWALRGVLLLNAVLTVREKSPNSHQKKGWEPFTTAVLRHVASSPQRIVFLCFGKPALKLVESLGTTHPIVAAPHPSPLNGRAFVDTVTKEKLFSKVNSLLDAPLDWSL